MINSENRSCLLVVHPYREEAKSAAVTFAKDLQKNGFSVYSNIDIAGALNFTNGIKVEIALVLGGDGTILRAAELVKDNKTPILGVNLGHVGFLAEIEKPSISEVVDAIVNKDYKTEDRMILNYKLK